VGDAPRVEFSYFCDCGQRIKGWAADNDIANQELTYWLRGHKDHKEMSETVWRRHRRKGGQK
jgi:hypothetical protein